MPRSFAPTTTMPALSCVVLLLSLLGCMKTDGGGDPPTPPAGPGTVSLLVADGPADDFDEIRVKVTEISLIPAADSSDGRPVLLYQDNGGYEINLLDLRDEDLILTVDQTVPAGRYSKVRMRIAQITPVGGPFASIKLPSGTIDCSLQGAIELAANTALAIRLDIDGNKSLHITGTGPFAQCAFRPVVFVDVASGRPGWRCQRLHAGTISDFIVDDATQALLGFRLDLLRGRGTLVVRLSDTTAVFDGAGSPIEPEALALGDPVGVRGALNAYGHFEASLVVVGQVLFVRGTVLGSVQNGQFSFRPDPAQELGGTVTVAMASTTTIHFGCDQKVGSDSIKQDMRVRIAGKYATQDGILRAIGIALRPAEIVGELLSWDSVVGGTSLLVRQTGGQQARVFVPSRAPIQLAGDGLIPFNLLCPGLELTATIDPSISARVTATGIAAEPQRVEGAVTDVRDATRRLLVEGKNVHAWPGATVFVRTSAQAGEDQQTLGTFSSMDLGDQVICYGLPTCGDAASIFEAYCIVVNKL